MSDAKITLSEVINSAVENGARHLRTCMPGRVTKWDPDKCRANVKPLIQDVTEAEDESREVASMPVIPGVPVQFMGAGGYRMTFPIEEGTLGTLFFSHRSLDRWLSGDGKEVDPELDHAHSLTDAIFIPGLMPFGAPWQSVPSDEASIGDDADGNGRVHFPGGEVLLGDGATKKVARQNDGVGNGTLAFTFGAGSGAATLAIVYTPGDGTAPQSLPAGSGTITIKEKITGGSDHIKAVD
jgi:hypothetical protein